jgi:hypothetical protein
MQEVKNAKLYTIGSGHDVIQVTHLWGTPWVLFFLLFFTHNNNNNNNVVRSLGALQFTLRMRPCIFFAQLVNAVHW